MQDGTVGWDPISIDHHLPWQEKLFVLYLLFVLGMAILRSVSLARQLWLGRSKWRFVAQNNASEQLRAEALADLGLANGLHDGAIPLSVIAKEGIQLGSLSRTSKWADVRFVYSGEMVRTKVNATKRLALLTLLLTMVVFADATTSMLAGIAMEKRVWIAAVAGGFAEVVQMVSLGLLVSAMLYALSSFYSGVLARRMASWKFFCASATLQGDNES